MTSRLCLLLVVGLLWTTAAAAQTQALNGYLDSPTLRMTAADVAGKPSAMRTAADVRGVSPLAQPGSFSRYVQARLSKGLLNIESLRLNKMLAAAPGTAGTALVSRVAAPAVLGAAIEYGGILQQSSGMVTTLRANALGIGRVLLGGEQFPYCPEIDSERCGGWSRTLRLVSGSVSFQDVRASTSVPTTNPPTEPTASDLLSDDYRVASWGLRVDLTRSNNLDDPKFIAGWSQAIVRLQADPVAARVTAAIANAFDPSKPEGAAYLAWRATAEPALISAPTASAFYSRLEEQLELLIAQLTAANPDFALSITAMDRAFANYFDVRDALIREAQVHKMSLEYTNRRPLDQPSMSNLRFVYSHQPSEAPTVVTANLSATFYDDEGPNGERWRDLQVSGQIDRRIGMVPNFGNAIATFAVYYQWMRDDALIQLQPGSVAPGTGIELPSQAATVLGTKGHIVVGQAQLSIPVNQVMKVPFSVTVSNRKELIDETDVRGQIGMTIDLDVLFH